MKKTIVALLMSLATAAAFALPSPKAIEHALEAHDYQSAHSMTQEVLREKPDSAKAHLYNAYILLHSGQPAAANEELNNVNRLDHHSGVVGSALYGRTVAELERPVAVQRQQRPVAAPIQVFEPSPQPKRSGVNWGLLLGLMAVAGGVAYLIMRKRTPEPVHSFAEAKVSAVQTEPAEIVDQPVRRVVYRAPEFVPPTPPVYQSTVSSQQPGNYGGGMGVMGTAAAVAGGVVAGNAISSAFSSRRRDEDDYEDRRRRQRESDSYTPAPVYESPERSYSTPSYESSSSSYSAGDSSSYDSGSSSSDSGGGGDW